MSDRIYVQVDVTTARSGVREAIWLSEAGCLNPGDALRLAGDIAAAVEIVDHLCPPKTLAPPKREETDV